MKIKRRNDVVGDEGGQRREEGNIQTLKESVKNGDSFKNIIVRIKTSNNDIAGLINKSDAIKIRKKLLKVGTNARYLISLKIGKRPRAVNKINRQNRFKISDADNINNMIKNSTKRRIPIEKVRIVAMN